MRTVMKYLSSNAFLILVITVALVFAVLFCMTFDTEYSSHFNRSSWDKVIVGMSESEVISVMGEPLSVDQWIGQEKKTLNYSKSRSNNSNYIHYYLVIEDGKVIEKKKEIFWD